jgi:hypothetical protein
VLKSAKSTRNSSKCSERPRAWDSPDCNSNEAPADSDSQESIWPTQENERHSRTHEKEMSKKRPCGHSRSAPRAPGPKQAQRCNARIAALQHVASLSPAISSPFTLFFVTPRLRLANTRPALTLCEGQGRTGVHQIARCQPQCDALRTPRNRAADDQDGGIGTGQLGSTLLQAQACEASPAGLGLRAASCDPPTPPATCLTVQPHGRAGRKRGGRVSCCIAAVWPSQPAHGLPAGGRQPPFLVVTIARTAATPGEARMSGTRCRLGAGHRVA